MIAHAKGGRGKGKGGGGGRDGGELKAVEGSSLPLSRPLARLRPAAGVNRSTGHRRHRVIAELSLTGRSIDYYFYAPRPA